MGGFYIEEQGGKKRTLGFFGRALPYRPISFTGTMRSEVSYYPGNPIGTAQVLGAAEEDTTVSGCWKDRYIRDADDEGNRFPSDGSVGLDDGEGGAQFLRDVESVARLVDDFRMQGQLVRVSWETLTRIGLIKSFKQTWQRVGVCEWELTFTWISRGEEELPINFAQPPDQKKQASSFDNLMNVVTGAVAEVGGVLDQVTSVAGTVQGVESQVSDVSASFSSGMALVTSYKDQLQAHTAQMQGAVDSIKDIAATSQAAVTDMQQSARLTQAAIQDVKAAAASLRTAAQSLAPASILLASETREVTFGEALAAASYQRGVAAAALQMQSFAALQGAAIASTLNEQEVVQVFDAREATDLRDVATKFYGSPEDWKRLMVYNGLTSSKLAAGMEILVPKSRTGGQAST